MWICPKCGTQNPVENNYCANCGKAKIQNNRSGYIILVAIIILLIAAIIVLTANSRQPQTIIYTSTESVQQPATVSSAPKSVQQPAPVSSAPKSVQQPASEHSTSTSLDNSSISPSSKDIDNIGADIEYPNSGDYLRAYETMYVSANVKGSTVYALHGLNDGGSWKSLAHEVADGTKVTVIAKHSYSDSTGFFTYACCIYSANGNQRAGWINMEHLSDYN